jgi:hypothetical protein
MSPSVIVNVKSYHKSQLTKDEIAPPEAITRWP